MAVRIYALAKELKLDSKELVDICTKAGIPGKGSALASLTEEEVVRVKEFYQGGSSGRGRSAPSKSTGPAPAPERPSQATRSGKMPVIVSRPPTLPTPTRSQPAAADAHAASDADESPADESTAEVPVAEGSDADVSTAAELTATESAAIGDMSATEGATAEGAAAEGAATGTTAESPAAGERSGQDTSVTTSSGGLSESRGPLAGAMRREEYVAPGAATGKVPTVGGSEPKPGNKKKPEGGANRGRRAIKLAPMPKAKAPAVERTADEPPAQKPDMKLPVDILGSGKMGSKPLAAHLRRHERNLEAKQKRTGPATPAPAAEPDKTATTVGRGRGARRGGKELTDDQEGRPMLGGREQRQLQRRRSQTTVDGDDAPVRRSSSRRLRRSGSGASTAAPRKDRISVQLPCTVRQLSEAAGLPANQILRILMEEGLMMPITAVMDPEMTEFVADELGIDVEFVQATTLEDELLAEVETALEDTPEQLTARPPVITFLGHVDHGKTSLLDRILGIDVVSGESGGITQHIRAYTIQKDGRRISFVDTPGHEAFTEMRARGANVTDIAVLVVAADDGVMPQTEEAISHARAAGVPIVVALNKTDLPGVDLNRAMQGLSTNELLPSEWGGDVEVIKTSAITGDGIDELLETVLTVAELHELQANPDRAAVGTCLEAQQEAGRGIVAKMLVQNGSLRVGDVVVCGRAHGRVKALCDTLNSEVRLDVAGPSTPVNLIGLDTAPSAGEHFYVLDDIARARSFAEARANQERVASLGGAAVQHVTLETLFDRLEGATEVQTLNLILRADVRGSIEAIQKEFQKLEHPEVRIKILQATVGGISEADVTLADASDAIIIGFNVVPDEGARQSADAKQVQIRRYDVIYKITEDLRAALEGMLRPEEREVELGRALVQQVFKISRVGTVAGCRVISGVVQRNARSRVIRDNTVIGDYPLDTLRREKDDTKEVREGFECGIKLAGFNDIKEADILEVYKIEEVGRSFDN